MSLRSWLLISSSKSYYNGLQNNFSSKYYYCNQNPILSNVRNNIQWRSDLAKPLKILRQNSILMIPYHLSYLMKTFSVEMKISWCFDYIVSQLNFLWKLDTINPIVWRKNYFQFRLLCKRKTLCSYLCNWSLYHNCCNTTMTTNVK
jgi:hypothetical protein